MEDEDLNMEQTYKRTKLSNSIDIIHKKILMLYSQGVVQLKCYHN